MLCCLWDQGGPPENLGEMLDALGLDEMLKREMKLRAMKARKEKKGKGAKVEPKV